MLHLLDGTFLFFRGLHSQGDEVVDSLGRPTGGVAGFASAVLSLLTAARAQHALVLFDESLGSGFRHELFVDYKATRPLPDDNIRRQLEACQQLCTTLGVSAQASTRFEADDLIASAAARWSGEVRIASRDKDLKQLLSDRVVMFDPVTRVTHSGKSFAADFGFASALFPDYQALVGDSSDNVPGVPGIGDKTARLLVARYGALESVLASPPRWQEDGVKLPPTGRVFQGLGEFGERALQMRELLRLSTQAPEPDQDAEIVAVPLEPAQALATELGLGGLGASIQRFLARSE